MIQFNTVVRYVHVIKKHNYLIFCYPYFSKKEKKEFLISGQVLVLFIRRDDNCTLNTFMA